MSYIEMPSGSKNIKLTPDDLVKLIDSISQLDDDLMEICLEGRDVDLVVLEKTLARVRNR